MMISSQMNIILIFQILKTISKTIWIEQKQSQDKQNNKFLISLRVDFNSQETINNQNSDIQNTFRMKTNHKNQVHQQKTSQQKQTQRFEKRKTSKFELFEIQIFKTLPNIQWQKKDFLIDKMQQNTLCQSERMKVMWLQNLNDFVFWVQEIKSDN